jgi:hypothetical protein
MPSFAVQPNYKYIQPNLVTINAAEVSLPAVSLAGLVSPSKIFIQALSANTENVFIGPTGVLTTGANSIYEIAPGGSVYLPNHLLSYWKMICASGGQKVMATYFKGVF